MKTVVHKPNLACETEKTVVKVCRIWVVSVFIIVHKRLWIATSIPSPWSMI